MTESTPLDDLPAEIRRLVADAPDRDGALQGICELLRERVEQYDWVGFYLADAAAGTLRLGPYAGDPTEHVEIAFGEGVCGQAARRRETVLVQDVSKESNYLACSPAVRSEIVVPVLKAGEIVAELDVDSHRMAAFSPADRAFLEDVADVASGLF